MVNFCFFIEQEQPQIFRVNAVSEMWLIDLEEFHQVQIDWTHLSNFTEVIQKFSSKINGYILYDIDNTSNINTGISVSILEVELFCFSKEK